MGNDKVYKGYSRIGEGIEFYIAPNNKIKSIVSLSDGAGVCHICEDDHCFVLYQGGVNYGENDYFRLATHIFPEAFEELRKLTLKDLKLVIH